MFCWLYNKPHGAPVALTTCLSYQTRLPVQQSKFKSLVKPEAVRMLEIPGKVLSGGRLHPTLTCQYHRIRLGDCVRLDMPIYYWDRTWTARAPMGRVSYGHGEGNINVLPNPINNLSRSSLNHHHLIPLHENLPK